MRLSLGFAVIWSATLAAQSPPVAPVTQSPDTPVVQAPADAPVTAAPESRPSFAEWLDTVRAEALTRGIRPEIVEAAFTGVTEPLAVVLERDRTQAEAILSLEQYINRRVSPTLVRRGRDAFTANKPALEQVARDYGVPARIVAGIWGIESNFGSFSGIRPTINALATLAWDPRRATFFRGELFSALEILNRGDIELAQLRGSWAGALGQPQFMPSSYLEYATDFDGDGRRDIWGSRGDVFASIANYLRGHGWIREKGWGREVKLTKEAASRIAATLPRREGGCRARRDMTAPLPLSEWRALGARTVDGAPVPDSGQVASLVSGASRYFLVYENYDALLAYNCAHAYALSVIILGERVARPSSVPVRK
jgi:membrane-bound lytic murein transglycosylase B